MQRLYMTCLTARPGPQDGTLIQATATSVCKRERSALTDALVVQPVRLSLSSSQKIMHVRRDKHRKMKVREERGAKAKRKGRVLELIYEIYIPSFLTAIPPCRQCIRTGCCTMCMFERQDASVTNCGFMIEAGQRGASIICCHQHVPPDNATHKFGRLFGFGSMGLEENAEGDTQWVA